jgi:hypothetical protein
MPLLQGALLVAGLAVFSFFAGANSASIAPSAEVHGFILAQTKEEPWKLNPPPERLRANPGEICAEEGARLYGISAKEFKTVSVQREQGGEGKLLVRLSIGKEWYACTLDRFHGLVDFRGG